MGSRGPNASLERQIKSYLWRRYIDAPRTPEKRPEAIYIEVEIGELARVMATYVHDEAKATRR